MASEARLRGNLVAVSFLLPHHTLSKNHCHCHSPGLSYHRLCLVSIAPSQRWPCLPTWPRALYHSVILLPSHGLSPRSTKLNHSEPNRKRSHSCWGRQCFWVQRPEADGRWLRAWGEGEGCLPCRSCGFTDEVNLKLILLSTQDDSFEIFFDPQTRDFYTVTVENEDEGNEQDEALLGNASQLAHSVRAQGLHWNGVPDRHPQVFSVSDSPPPQPSISTASNNVRSDGFDCEEAI